MAGGRYTAHMPPFQPAASLTKSRIEIKKNKPTFLSLLCMITEKNRWKVCSPLKYETFFSVMLSTT